MADLPYYGGVPKDIEANLKWRREVIKKAGEDTKYAASCREMCAEDILFYINVFCWTKDPRDQNSPVKPFVTYDYQDDAIVELCDAVETGYSLAWPKTRGMGASWMAITVFQWFWRFWGNLEFGMVSRKEDLVDERRNVSSLFGKIDFIHDHQPSWLVPAMKRNQGIFVNLENDSTIVGETTTENMFRSGRLTACFVDEFGAFKTQDSFQVLDSLFSVTPCTLYCSTPKGIGNGFHKLVHETAVKKRYMHFSEHPEYSKGLYTTDEKGNVELLNDFEGKVKIRRIDWEGFKEFQFPDEYPFILDGKQRSPWYDDKEAEVGSKQTMAQEVNINFLGSEWQFFDPEFINKLKSEYCMEPNLRGKIKYSGIESRFDGFKEIPEGPVSLWFNLSPRSGAKEFISDNKYGVGADVSAGTGASNSVATVVDLKTGKKVALWKDPNTYPEDFADICVAICRWFNDAKLIWDASGPTGQTFSNHIIDVGYSNLYYKQEKTKINKNMRSKPGYFLNPKDRATLLSEYRSSLSKREFINVSFTGMDEALQFIQKPGGKAIHSLADKSQDPSGAREAHGDECIADALSAKLLKITRERENDEPQSIPENCMAKKLERWEQEKEEELEYW